MIKPPPHHNETGNVCKQDSPIKSAVPQAAPAPNNTESTIIYQTAVVVVIVSNITRKLT